MPVPGTAQVFKYLGTSVQSNTNTYLSLFSLESVSGAGQSCGHMLVLCYVGTPNYSVLNILCQDKTNEGGCYLPATCARSCLLLLANVHTSSVGRVFTCASFENITLLMAKWSQLSRADALRMAIGIIDFTGTGRDICQSLQGCPGVERPPNEGERLNDLPVG